MGTSEAHTLTKLERLSGKRNISRLMSEGRWGSCQGFKFCCLRETGEDVNRLMVSVPKRLFKRAVKRNLLKRRIREAWRTQKDLLTPDAGTDILILYNSPEIMTTARISESVAAIMHQVSGWE